MPDIPHWKVQAALRLLGYDPEEVLELQIWSGVGQVWMTSRDLDSQTITQISFDPPEDTRMRVLGIDPENGNAELSVVEDAGPDGARFKVSGE